MAGHRGRDRVAAGQSAGRDLAPRDGHGRRCWMVDAILGGLAAGFVVEGQLDLEWHPGGLVGAALGALLVLLWLRLDTR